MMKSKMMAAGGMMKKGYAAGGAAKKKESATGAMKMVEKNGKKVPAFAADGGVSDDYRASRKAEREAKQQAEAEKRETLRQEKAKRAYDYHTKSYQGEMKDAKQSPFVGKIHAATDKIGDSLRSVGKNVFGTNRMTSKDDEAQMQARKDVKGYKKGGSVSSASSRADGCAVKGKTKGRIV